MTNERLPLHKWMAELRATAEGQLEAEADGGYAAGDGPYYDADAILTLLNALQDAVVAGLDDLGYDTEGIIWTDEEWQAYQLFKEALEAIFE
jgi:hypothetical protein